MNNNGFSKTLERIKYYCLKNKKQFHLQLIVTAAISIILIGQLGASRDFITGVTKRITKNPFMILWHAITMFPLTFGIFLLLNIVILVLFTNMKDNLYDNERNFQISEKGTMGTGGFMKAEDKQNALYMDTIENTNGMILGKDPDTGLILSPRENLFLNGHKYVCGGSGARKTTTQVMNDLYQYLKANESFMVTDPKGEIYGMLAAMCKKHGYNVKVLNLVNFINSDAIDFVKCCRDDNGNQDVEVKNVMTLVAVIMANTSDEKEAGFWKDQQTGLLTAAILYVMYDHTGLTEPTLGGAYNFIINNRLSELERKFRNLDPTHPARIQISDFLDSKEEIQSSAKLGLKQRLQILQLNSVQQIISRDEIDLVEPGRSKCAYFIIMSDQERTFDFISSLFFCMFFIKIVAYADSTDERKTKVPVHLVMDEFPSIGTILDLSRKFATLRSRQILITIIFQNIGQVMDKYEKHEWQTILSNCDIGVYLGGNDSEETAKFFLNRIGELTAVSKGIRKEESIFSPTGNRFYPTNTVTESETKRPVMTVDEFMRLPLDEAIVLLKSNRPLKVLKFVHTEHPYSKEIVELNAVFHIPVWRRENEGYPLEFTDNELAPLIQEMLATRQMAQYLSDRNADRTYDFMTYLAENRPDIFPTYRDIYMERIRQEQEAAKESNIRNTATPADGYTQENANAEFFTQENTGSAQQGYERDQQDESLGTKRPAASSSDSSSASSEPYESYDSYSSTVTPAASFTAPGTFASSGTAPADAGNTKHPAPPLPTMPPLASGYAYGQSVEAGSFGTPGTGRNGMPNTGDHNGIAHRGSDNIGSGNPGQASPAASPQTVESMRSSVSASAAGPANPSQAVSQNNGRADGITGTGNRPFLSGADTPANPYAASGTGDPGMGAFGAGNSSPRRSQRPKRTFKKVDLKAEIEEAEENQKKQKEQKKEAGKVTQTASPAAKNDPGPSPNITGETSNASATGVTPSGSASQIAGYAADAEISSRESANPSAPLPENAESTNGLDSHRNDPSDQSDPSPAKEAVPINTPPMDQTTALNGKDHDPGQESGCETEAAPNPGSVIPLTDADIAPDTEAGSEASGLSRHPDVEHKGAAETSAQEDEHAIREGVDPAAEDRTTEAKDKASVEEQPKEHRAEGQQTGSNRSGAKASSRSLKPVHPNLERETTDSIIQEHRSPDTPAAGSGDRCERGNGNGSRTGSISAPDTRPAAPSGSGKPLSAPADLFGPSSQGTDQNGTGNRFTALSADPSREQPPIPPHPITKTNFRVFDIHAASPSSSLEKSAEAASPAIQHEVGIKRKGDTHKKGLKKITPSDE